MNVYAVKPMPHAVKLRKLWAGQFYLAPVHRQELEHQITDGQLKHEREAVAFIEEHGEWLD